MEPRYETPPPKSPKPKAKGFDFLDGIYGKRQKPRNQNFGHHFQHR